MKRVRLWRPPPPKGEYSTAYSQPPAERKENKVVKQHMIDTLDTRWGLPSFGFLRTAHVYSRSDQDGEWG